MKKKRVIIPFFAIFIIILLIIFYREGILFNRNGSDNYSDSLKQEQDSGNVVPLGNPPPDGGTTDSISGNKGSSNTETSPDGVVSPKDKKMVKDSSNKVVPLGKPPTDEGSKNKGNEGSSETPSQEDKSK